MTQTPLKIEGINESLYAGFWIRLGSILLDFLIVIPFTGIILLINNLGLHYYYYTFIPSLIFSLWYNIYLVKKYGGTPGKLIAGIKIVKINGQEVDWFESTLRHIVMFGITLFSIALTIRSIGLADESYYSNLSWVEKSQYLMSLSPLMFTVYNWISNIWIYGELIVLLTNKRKRAIHDYIAGTVIIKKKYESQILENLENQFKN